MCRPKPLIFRATRRSATASVASAATAPTAALILGPKFSPIVTKLLRRDGERKVGRSDSSREYKSVSAESDLNQFLGFKHT